MTNNVNIILCQDLWFTGVTVHSTMCSHGSVCPTGRFTSPDLHWSA